MSQYEQIKAALKKASEDAPVSEYVFFKTAPGEYAEHDRFIGVNVPTLRKIAKDYKELSLSESDKFLRSPINEERLLALFILIHQYDKGKESEKDAIYQFYLDNLKYVNNWNLVDASAPLIMGKHLLNKDRSILLALAKSTDLWERRVAIVTTWYFIRNNQFDWTIRLAESLLQDTHDLIHKAVGWMLREVGKKDLRALEIFLERQAHQMPRTMLRYAIERFSKERRREYLKAKNK